MPKVSIIIPVYNVEDYLAQCLDSIINQTFTDIEIICVNDGSTDNSYNILQHYQNYDARIKIINKKNGGLSSARNAGLDTAKSKYVYFIDSDDYCSTTTIETCYNNAEKNNSDVVIFDFVWTTPPNDKPVILTISQYGNKYENSSFNINSMDALSYKYIPVSTWSKFYNREFLTQNNLRFYEDMIYEDVPFWASIYSKAKRITYIKTPLYFYRKNRTGALTTLKGKEVFDVLKAYDRVENSMKKAGHWEKYHCAINLLMIMDYTQKLWLLDPKYKEEFYNIIKSLPIDLNEINYEQNNFSEIEKISVRKFEEMQKTDYKTFCKNNPRLCNG